MNDQELMEPEADVGMPNIAELESAANEAMGRIVAKTFKDGIDLQDAADLGAIIMALGGFLVAIKQYESELPHECLDGATVRAGGGAMLSQKQRAIGKLNLAIADLLIKGVPVDSPRQIILRRTLSWWEKKAGLGAAQ